MVVSQFKLKWPIVVYPHTVYKTTTTTTTKGAFPQPNNIRLCNIRMHGYMAVSVLYSISNKVAVQGVFDAPQILGMTPCVLF